MVNQIIIKTQESSENSCPRLGKKKEGVRPEKSRL